MPNRCAHRLSQSAAFDPLTRRLETALQEENSRVEVFLLDEMADDRPGTDEAASAEAAKAEFSDDK